MCFQRALIICFNIAAITLYLPFVVALHVASSQSFSPRDEVAYFALKLGLMFPFNMRAHLLSLLSSIYSHWEHFTLGIIMASGPFELVFLGLGFVWRGGGLIPWSCRSTGAGAGGVMPRAKSRGVAGSGTPISSVFPASFFLIRASKSIFNRKYFQLILNMRGDRYQNVSVPKRKMRKD